MELPITNGFYLSDSLPVSHQECVNWYVNIVESQGLSRETLFGTPGITQLLTTGATNNINRGSWVKNGIPYFVNGEVLYSITRSTVLGVETFTANTLGTIPGTARVSMADNGTQLMVLIPGGNGYIYNENDAPAFKQITDVDFTANGDPQYVVFIDGYFAVTTDSKKWIVSNLNDGLSWTATDFGTAESDPDNTVAPVVINNQIFITGSETTEGFQNIGGAGFPFQRNNIFLDKGCKAPFTIIKTNGRFFMVGAGKNESPSIWEFTGNNYNKISTTAIDNILHEYTDSEISAAFSWSYARKGGFFVGFSFPDRTFVFDMVTQRWHERKSLINEEQTAWRANSMVEAYGRIMVGDSEDGKIGELDSDVYTEYDEIIIRTVSTQPFANQSEPLFIPRLELTMESGVGNDDESEPVVTMATSKNGRTFSYERSRRIGQIGDYKRRVVWRRNGRYPRFVVFKFTLSDPVKPVIIKLEVS